MRKLNVVVAVAAAFAASTAYAQSSVTLFGIVDGGFVYQNQNGSSGHSAFNAISGGQNTSRWGLLGTEDLGGGLKAGFQLVDDFNTMNGSAIAPGVAFSRYANVYIESTYGRVTAGLQIDPAYGAMLLGDPNDGTNYFSGVNYWLMNEGNTVLPGATLSESNAVSYRFSRGAFKIEALYAFGNVPGEFSAGQAISVGSGYDNGRVAVAGGYLQKNNASGQRDLRTYTMSVGYHADPLFFRVGFTDFDQPLGNNSILNGPGTPASNIEVLDSGVSWTVSPALTLKATYYFAEDRKNTSNAASQYSVNASYSLSKQTSIYCFTGIVDAKAGANSLTAVSTISSAILIGAPGRRTVTAGGGLIHYF
ncbi:porin [Paraburkholderia sediminicola]|uniref:porin n=1 Tax=Paraburkholderia sediminicola TaxID=458836 RepID=UPI0038BB7D26